MTQFAKQTGALPRTIEARLEGLGTGPVAFWFLNHDLDTAELSRQMVELKEKGFSGFFMHPRGGLRVPYGSEAWYEVIDHCVAEARRLGMEAWLYDEDPYPSGAAGGRITMEHPEYRARELVAVCGKSGDGVLHLPSGPLLAAYLISSEGDITRIDDRAGLVREQWQQFFSTTGYYSPYQPQGAPHWRAETLAPHYVLPLSDLPDGSEVMAFVAQPALQNPWGDYPDLLNPAAVELFFHYTHDRYAERLGEECGTTVPGIFTDEAKLKGRLPWSAGVAVWFEELTGRSLLEVLPHLVRVINGATPYYRWAYRKALARGLREVFVEPMAERCRSHGLLLTGHVSPEENPLAQVLFVPGLMGVIGQMDIPGTDLIGAVLGGEERPMLHLSPKIASSAAHGHGKRFVGCEAFAVCDWSQDMASLTRALHWLYALGVNRLVTHGQFYSIDGLRKREAPPSQFFQSAYWEHFGAFSEMVSLLSRELSKGDHVAPLLLYYPEESFMALASGRLGPENGGAEAMQEELGELVHGLLTSGYDFDFADEELLLEVSAEAGGARLRSERFEAVIVPGRHLTEATHAHLQRLEEAGLRIAYVEPEITILSPDPYRRKTGGGESALWRMLRSEVAPLWRAEGRLLAHQRETDAGPLLFLCNNADESFHGPVALSFPGPYEVCRPQEGEWKLTLGLELELPAGLGVLIRQAQAVAEGNRCEDAPLRVEWSDWSSLPLGANVLVLHEYHGLWRDEVPALSEFSRAPQVDLLAPSVLNSQLREGEGERWLMTSFEWRAGTAEALLVCDTELGEGESSFFLNGTLLPPPARQRVYDPLNRVLDLRPYLQSGRNHLLWRERFAGKKAVHPLPYDALRIIGEFLVTFPYGRPTPARLTERCGSSVTGFPVPPAQMGHPHYGGIVEYESDFRLSNSPSASVSLEIEHLYESAEVIVNGHLVGYLWAAPYRLEIPLRLLQQDGWNRLTLRCSCSPATYLQALARPAGVIGPIRLHGA